MTKLVGRGSRKGSSPLSRLGDVLRLPVTWLGIAGVVSATGPKGREAALRGVGCYLTAALLHLPLKALIGRSHPRGASLLTLGPYTSSFPSGHAAADLAFTLAASQVMPALRAPLTAATFLAEFSLVRRRAHYVTDILAGAALGFAVSLAARKLFPVRGDQSESAGEGDAGEHSPPSFAASDGHRVTEPALP